MWFIYILRCSDNSLYTGVAKDVVRREKEHNTNNKKGAKYTRNRRPVKVVYSEPAETRSAACIREAQIKKLTKNQKEKLVRNFDEWFAELVNLADNYETGLSMDKESWRGYFNSGLSPKEAIEAEIGSN